MQFLTNIQVHLRVAGALLLCVGIGHVALPRALGWSTELEGVSLMTRQVSYVHTYFIGLMCGLFGLAATLLAHDLVTREPMAKAVLVAAVVVWGSRLITEFCVFDSSLWRGRTLTVLGHVAFALLWSYETLVFALALTTQVR